ncbi:MAG: transcription antitermination factor NusB [Chitinophagaceae bacterium]
MINRRNIRVKVMQTLYSLDSMQSQWVPGQEFRILQKHFDQTKQLFVYSILFITELARYAETAAMLRASKHLPSQEDLNVNIKSAGNQIIWQILEDAIFQKAVKEWKADLLIEKDIVRKIYLQLVETEEYKAYIAVQGRERKSEKDFLQYLYTNFLLPNQVFIDHIEEHFTNWDDDGEMISQLVAAYLAKPSGADIDDMISKEKLQYAKSLLETVLTKEEPLMNLITPKLTNWDPERIATLDMILMKMGVAEFLYFETIPPKVTINEYIDLAKDYSTPQSGQFVNGILDTVHKELVNTQAMNKITYKKS